MGKLERVGFRTAVAAVILFVAAVVLWTLPGLFVWAHMQALWGPHQHIIEGKR
jgi:hypothetical protein